MLFSPSLYFLLCSVALNSRQKKNETCRVNFLSVSVVKDSTAGNPQQKAKTYIKAIIYFIS